VVRLLVRQGVMLSLTGVAMGTLSSFVLAGFLRSLVFGVSIADPATLFSASAILTAAAVLACWVPSRRVMGVDPIIALRHE
jgi:putative ABC transport system permease protein